MSRNRLTAAQYAAFAEARAKPIRSGKARLPAALVAPSWAVEFVVPCITKSMTNHGGSGNHWSIRYRLFKQQEQAVATVMAWSLASIQTSQGVPLVLTFTRLGGSRMDPDNLAGSMKAVQDALCRRLGRDDGDRALTFDYRQEPSTGPCGVRVRVESKL